jgi:Cu2+-exporting ATPase
METLSVSKRRPAPLPGMPEAAGDAQCYHCGLPVPPGSDHRVTILGAAREMCCPGCRAVAQAIVDSGNEGYYRHRTRQARNVAERVPEFLRELEVFDHPAAQKGFVGTRPDGSREAWLILENITCAACVWLNERHLRAQPGVLEARVNYATQRAHVIWDPARIALSGILRSISEIGYFAHPYDPHRREALIERERRAHLKRLGIAGLFSMQVMMLAAALYIGEARGMEPAMRAFFRWISLLLTLPVFYSAQPFFAGAWRDLRLRRVSMDVPVVLGIAVAFLGSAHATLTGSGHVYYDSVTMFVFLLTATRYFELVARQRGIYQAEAVSRSVPAVATRRLAAGGTESVAVTELQAGDVLLVRPGETFPADGVITDGVTTVDESLLTGESRPLPRGVGDAVIAGSVNVEQPLSVRVTGTGLDTTLSRIGRLIERAQGEKPALAQAADRVAAVFVLVLLVFAAGVALYWSRVDPSLVLPATVAVLVITCPCALSLATPAALSVATQVMSRYGLVVTRGHALEALARADHFVFDKTGTLTEGRLTLEETRAGVRPNAPALLTIAGALEQHSEHPIARAIVSAAGSPLPAAQRVVNHPGQGIEGQVEGRSYCLGTADFVARRCGTRPQDAAAETAEQTALWLADERAVLATFLLRDHLRPGAAEAVGAIRATGSGASLFSGDQEGAVRAVARAAGITDAVSRMTPDAKLAGLRALQSAGRTVAMIGDGVNDAPVLSAATVSVAMGSGAHLAQAAGDILLLNSRLERLATGVRIARATQRVVRQNLAWAAAYNLVAIPAAASGTVSPWLAALGMSLSSVLVVANALRLHALGPDRRARTPE